MQTKLTLGTKLVGSVAVLLLLAGLQGFFGLRSARRSNDQFDVAVDRTVHKVILIERIGLAVTDMVSAQRGLVIAGFSKDNPSFDRYEQEYQLKLATIQKSLNEMLPLQVRQEGKTLTAEIRSSLAPWGTYHAELLSQANAGHVAEAERIRKENMAPIYRSMIAATNRLRDIQSEILTDDKREGDEDYASNRNITIGLLALALLGAAIIIVIVRGISHDIRRAVLHLGEGAEQVASAAVQVSSASQSMAQGASEQAASLEETSSSSEEINSMTRKNAENSKVAAEFTGQVDERVAAANQSLEQMVTSMGEINTSSDKVSKIIKVIDEIAFQTNILALNAAVEAARAGEAGMGFAVVADEVRNLAQRCAQAAKDTALLIEESIVKSREGMSKLDQVAEATRSITQSASKVKTLVDEVHLGSEEQARGIEQIAKAIAQMEQVTQKNAAHAEESASASEQLSAQAETMRSVVSDLQALVEGSSQDTSREPSGRNQNAAKLSSMKFRPTPDSRESSHVPASKQPSFLHAGSRTGGDGSQTAGNRLDRSALPLDQDFKEF